MRRSLLPSLWGGGRVARVDDPFFSLQREIDRVFNRFTTDFQLPKAGDIERFLEPDVDVSETDHDVQIAVELPGVDEKDVDVTLADSMLTIKGEKRAETEDKGKDYRVVERSYGAFERVIPVPYEIDPDTVDAKFAKGVLTVILPKPPEAKAKQKKIEIKHH